MRILHSKFGVPKMPKCKLYGVYFSEESHKTFCSFDWYAQIRTCNFGFSLDMLNAPLLSSGLLQVYSIDLCGWICCVKSTTSMEDTAVQTLLHPDDVLIFVVIRNENSRFCASARQYGNNTSRRWYSHHGTARVPRDILCGKLFGFQTAWMWPSFGGTHSPHAHIASQQCTKVHSNFCRGLFSQRSGNGIPLLNLFS